MQSTMDRIAHHAAVQRALALGRSADPAALPEIVALLATPSPEVRRLSASAIAKLAGFGADPATAVRALAPVALRDPHPQTQQYALKALKAYGAAAQGLLHDLYIEYWGMEDNLDYQIGMLEKKKLYQQAGKRLVSLHPADKDRLDEALGAKLVRLAPPPPSASAASQQHPPA
jgi:hypothetical protein